jgi:hypothetical protein
MKSLLSGPEKFGSSYRREQMAALDSDVQVTAHGGRKPLDNKKQIWPTFRDHLYRGTIVLGQANSHYDPVDPSR